MRAMRSNRPERRETMSIEGKAQAAFRKVYTAEQVNFMTPDPLGYGWLGADAVYELSGGRGFDHEPIFGVTVIEHGPEGWQRDSQGRSKCCGSKREADDYIMALMP